MNRLRKGIVYFSLCVAPNVSAAEQNDFVPEHYPFLPSLVEAAEPLLCESMLTQIQALFQGKSSASTASIADLDVLSWNNSSSHTAYIIVDKQQGYTPESIFTQWHYQGSRPEGYQDYYQIRAQVITTSDLSDYQPLNEWPIITQFDSYQDYTLAIEALVTSQGDLLYPNPPVDELKSTEMYNLPWRNESQFFIFKDQLFFMDANLSNPGLWDLQRLHPSDNDPISIVFKVNNNQISPACIFQIEPINPQNETDLLTYPEIDLFIETLYNIIGTDAMNYATYAPNTRNTIAVQDLLKRMAIRPWYYPTFKQVSEAQMDTFIEQWAYNNIWNYHVYQQYFNQKQDVLNVLAQYYQDVFAVPYAQANAKAIASLIAILQTGLTISRKWLDNYPSEPDDYAYQLHKAILKQTSIDHINELLDINTINTGEESLLFYALGQNELMQHLIELGAEVNYTNCFGKTALMYAAQFDQKNSIALLLNSGADINRQTLTSNDCNLNAYDIRISVRSALLYAAENASFDTIMMLIEADADVKVTDSMGETFLSYLKRNTQLSTQKFEDLKSIFRNRSLDAGQ